MRHVVAVPILCAALAGCSLTATDAVVRYRDAEGHKGTMFLWDGWSPLARADEATFNEARRVLGGRTHAENCDKCAVLLRGEGPEIEVSELPDGPH